MKIQLSDHFNYPRLLRFAVPSVLMIIFTSVYGVVDGYFISNYAGKIPFAAVNFIMPYLMILGDLGFIFGTGGSAFIGKTFGEGNPEKANRLFSMLVYVTLAVGTVIGIIGWFTAGTVASLLGATEDMLPICNAYSRIVLLTLPLVMLQFECQSFFVLAEKPKLGLSVTVAAGGTNMVLDWLFVRKLALCVMGAAWATAIAQAVGGIVPLIYFASKNTGLLHLGKAEFDGRALLKTLTNGSSEFVTCISMSVVSMIYNAQLLKYSGENGVAAYGVLMYVCLIFLSIFIGYAGGTAPIVSYHFGARNRDEMKNVLKRSLVIIGASSGLMLLAGELLAHPLSRLFVGYDEALMQLTVKAFYIYSLSFVFSALPIYASSYFTALNNGAVSAVISFLRTCVFQIAAVLLFPLWFGIDGIWYSLVAAEFAATVLALVFLLAQRKKYGY